MKPFKGANIANIIVAEVQQIVAASLIIVSNYE